jgi:glucosamine--fructose-6-phosphate aminotransferase (isomerizing)
MHAEHPIMKNLVTLADRATWQNSVDTADRAISTWLDGLGQYEFTRVYLTGCGTSFYAGQVGKYAVEHIAHLAAEAVQGFAFATYMEPAILDPQTLVVGISATGNTAAVCDTRARARQSGAPTLGITADPESNIARAADAVIPTGGKITVSVKTRTYVESLIAIYLLALHLGEAGGQVSPDQAAHWRKQIDLAADGARRFLDHQQGEIEELARTYAQAPNVFVLGTGPNAGTVEEASLKVIEMAKMFSEARELEDFMHGRLREVDGATPLFFVAPQGRASERTLDFLTVTDHVGAPSIMLTDQVTPGIERLATHVVQMPVQMDEFATPLLYILPLYLLGYHLAVERGYDAGARRYPDIIPQNVRYQEFRVHGKVSVLSTSER